MRPLVPTLRCSFPVRTMAAAASKKKKSKKDAGPVEEEKVVKTMSKADISLLDAIKEIESDFGSGSLMQLGSMPVRHETNHPVSVGSNVCSIDKGR